MSDPGETIRVHKECLGVVMEAAKAVRQAMKDRHDDVLYDGRDETLTDVLAVQISVGALRKLAQVLK